MRLVIQRVRSASVTSKEKIVGNIQNGLLVLVGFKKGDTKAEVEFLSEKLLKLRVMADGQDKMNLSVKDASAQLLVVSQFTLHANTAGGNRPSFVEAEDPDRARALYEYFVELLKKSSLAVATGSFGNYMTISTTLDGPVTITLDSK